MSAISSIGGASPLTYLQQLQQRGQDTDHDGDRDQANSVPEKKLSQCETLDTGKGIKAYGCKKET